MDLAQQLLRSCVRTFYETKHVLVLDALVTHSALRDDDMAYLMGMNTKELHKLCGRLKEDRFLTVHTRPELKEGQQRPMNRTYYYIDYRASIDAIKWRVFNVDKIVQGQKVEAKDMMAYRCPRCNAEYGILDVVGWNAGMSGFRCADCKFKPLIDIQGENEGGHEQSTKMSAQFRFITDLLPLIDDSIVPENTFAQAFAAATKVNRDTTNPASETVPVDIASERPTAVKGMANIAPAHIDVVITNSEGPTAAQIAAEKERKLKNAAANALPVHFTHSTITNEQINFESHNNPLNTVPTEDKKDIVLDDPAEGGDAGIDAFFKRMQAEKAQQDADEEAEEYETDDEEEDEFEDVLATGSGVGTPSSLVGDIKLSSTSGGSGLVSALKRSGSASGSGTSTGVTSPVTGPNTPNDDGRPAKKVRIEEPVVKDDPDSEEDMEFETVV